MSGVFNFNAPATPAGGAGFTFNRPTSSKPAASSTSKPTTTTTTTITTASMSWDQTEANKKYSKEIGAAERVHPGIQSAKAALKSDYEKYDTILSKGSLLKPSSGAHLFPARYYTKTEEEKQWQLRTEATAELGKKFVEAQAPNVQIQTTLPDKYVEWIEAKQKAEFFLGYDKWIEVQFLDGDLAKREFIKQVYPEYFAAREAEVEAKQALDKKIFDLKLHGPRDAEDLRLEYMLRTGAIIPDPTPIWDSSVPSGEKADAVLQRGFGSAHKWLLSKSINEATRADMPWGASGIAAGRASTAWPMTSAGTQKTNSFGKAFGGNFP